MSKTFSRGVLASGNASTKSQNYSRTRLGPAKFLVLDGLKVVRYDWILYQIYVDWENSGSNIIWQKLARTW